MYGPILEGGDICPGANSYHQLYGDDFGEAKLFVDYPGDWSGQKIFTFLIRALASPMLLSPLLFTDTATAP